MGRTSKTRPRAQGTRSQPRHDATEQPGRDAGAACGGGTASDSQGRWAHLPEGVTDGVAALLVPKASSAKLSSTHLQEPDLDTILKTCQGLKAMAGARLVCRYWGSALAAGCVAMRIVGGGSLPPDTWASHFTGLEELEVAEGRKYRLTASQLGNMRRLRLLTLLDATQPEVDCLSHLPTSLTELTMKAQRSASLGLPVGLAKLPQLKCLRWCPLPPSEVAAAGTLTGLTSLNMACSPSITPGHLAHLRGLQHLTSLNAGRCCLGSDSALEAIAALSSLRHLCLAAQEAAAGGPPVSAVGLGALGDGLTGLTHLDISDNEWGDLSDTELAGLRPLRRSLTSLDVQGCDSLVTDDNLRGLCLPEFGCLATLNLGCCHKLTNEGLEASGVQRLTSLTNLSLCYCFKVSDHGTSMLASLSRLTELDINGLPINDEGLSPLRALSALSSLRLWCGAGVSDSVFSSTLAHMPNLSRLRMYGRDSVSDLRGLAEAGRLASLRLESLTSLSLVGRSHLPTSVASLCHLSSLAALTLDWFASDSDPQGALVVPSLHFPASLSTLYLIDFPGSSLGCCSLSSVPALRHLCVANASNLTDSGLEPLAAATALQHLSIIRAQQVTAACVRVVQDLKALQWLNLHGTGVDALLKPKFREVLPEVTSLSIHD